MLQKKNPQQWRHLLPVKVVFQVLTPDRAIERSAGMITEDAGKRQVGVTGRLMAVNGLIAFKM